MSVLYVIACGSPVASRVGTLVDLAQRDGWEVCVVTSRDGRKFVDVPALAAKSGHPVRSEYKNPGDPDVLPDADAMVVAPATVNTMTKWSAGIADTLALGLLVEGIGQGLPIVALPFTNSAMAAHPAFGEAIVRLRSWGVTVLRGDDVVRFGPPGRASPRRTCPGISCSRPCLNPGRVALARGSGAGVRASGSLGCHGHRGHRRRRGRRGGATLPAVRRGGVGPRRPGRRRSGRGGAAGAVRGRLRRRDGRRGAGRAAPT